MGDQSGRDEIARLATDGPTEAELSRVKAQAEAQFVYRLQTVGGFGGKSDQLNAYNTFLRDPLYFRRDLDRYLVVTRDQVSDAAARHLLHTARVAVSVVPTGRQSAALADSAPGLVH